MSRPHGGREFWLGALRAEGPAFGAALAEAPPDAPVLSCPDWTVTDLAHHLGSTYRWLRTFLTTDPLGCPDPPPAHPTGLPTGAELAPWWRAEFDQLLTVLDGLDPETPAWNWAPQPKKAAFWQRRIAHETAIHRWDAQLAVAAGEPIEAKLACDGVSEALDTWLPAGRRKVHRPWYGMVHLTATDTGVEWYLRLRGAGVALLDTDTILDSDEHPARVRAAGTASDLLLALYGRLNFDALTVAGDTDLLTGLRIG